MCKVGKEINKDFFYKECIKRVVSLAIINYICVEYFEYTKISIIIFLGSIALYLIWFIYNIRNKNIKLDKKYIFLPILIMILVILCFILY